MNIFFRELKTQRKSLFFWCLGMFLMVWTGMEKYSGLQASGDAANKMLAQLPSSVKRIVGLEGLDINTAVGFYGVLFIYLAIMAAIHAVLLGSSLIAKEERDKTVEFLLAKPTSRAHVITEKLLAGLAGIIILNFFTLVVSVISVAQHNNGNPQTKIAILLMAGMFFIQLIFLTLGSLIAALAKKPKRAGSIATAAMMFTFIIYIFIGIATKISFLRFFTPFKYFEGAQIVQSSSLNISFVLLSLILVTGFSIGTYYFFDKKDLNI